MNTYVFTGPTISPDEASHWLDAVYLPPVAQGDIISLLRRQPRVIGIIDGYFERVPAVWHKEILLALSEGVYVVGGASMGALRAAELHTFGMVGVGEVFEWYRDAIIEADDEVAVRHGTPEDNYLILSEALVNIRKTLQLAHKEAIIGQSTLEALISIGRSTNYPERSYPSLVSQGRQSGLPEDEIAALEAYLVGNKVDQKKVDAIQLLEHIAALPDSNQPPEADFELQHTVFLQALMERDKTLISMDGLKVTKEELVNLVRLEIDDVADILDRATISELFLDAAKAMNVSLNEVERKQGLRHFRQTLGLESQEAMAAWMQHNHLTEAEFEQLVEEWALIEMMKRLYLQPSNSAIIRQLLFEGRLEEMVTSAAEKEKRVSNRHGSVEGANDEERLWAYYAKSKSLPEEQDRYAHAAQLGFSDRRSFLHELKKYYMYHNGE